MPRPRSARTSPTRILLPPELTAAASTLNQMRGSGLLDRASKAIGLSRRHGYDGGPVMAFFVAALLRGASGSIVGFAQQYRGRWMQALAALAGFRSLPTPSSVSRCLGSVTTANVHAFADQLLCGDPRTRSLLAHDAVQHRDTHGERWHVLDLDPTVTAYRQRGLPKGDDLPEAKRIAPGKRGYTGHHRGEVRTRLVPIRHAGAGLWLGCRLIEGSETALGSLRELARLGRTRLPSAGGGSHVILRTDGEFGSVGALRACMDENVAPVTRLSRYGILDAPSVQARLASATWLEVPDSGAGPRRYAADLGAVVLRPDEDAEGAEDGPVEVRVVVTRFARSTPPDHGVLRDGFQYELIATTLPTDAWPAEHVVALFFGRATMENAFAQDDREFGTDRTFSYNAPGQAWVAVIAQLLSNLATLDGVEAHPLPKKVPVQERRELPDPEPVVAEPQPAPTPTTIPTHPPAETSGPIATPAAPPLPSPPSKAEAHATLWGVVRRVFADIGNQTGWSLDGEARAVRCPAGQAAEQSCIGSARGTKRPTLFLRVPTERCLACPMRVDCLRSANPTQGKRIGRSIDSEVADPLKDVIDILQRDDGPGPLRGRGYEVKEPTETDPPHLPPGPWIPTTPLFLPAAARRLTRESALRGQFVCHIEPRGVRPPKRHALIARTDAERQRRRQSWTQRRERWESPYNATLSRAHRA